MNLPPARPPHLPKVRETAAQIGPLAWPVFVGQVSVLAFATIDTVLLARHSQAELAALSIGASAYITIFVGLMGVILALSPVAGRLFGARQHAAAGLQLKQAAWLALAMAVLGSGALLWPQPFLALARATPELAERSRSYLAVLALSLPASLLFTCFRSFNTAVSRPKAPMLINLGGLAIKAPLSWLLIQGSPALGLPAMGVTGCAVATAVAMWSQALAGWLVLRHDPFYRPFELRGWVRPRLEAMRDLLRLGLPMGLSILVEVCGFAWMAFLIARSDPGSLAGHQIAANLVSMMFMMALALASATGTLVAQRIGAGEPRVAGRIAWHGTGLTLGAAVLLGCSVALLREPVLRLYTHDATIAAAALPLLAWVALFHIADAAQTIGNFVLRAWHVAVVPLAIYVVALVGVGLGGGIWLHDQPWLPAPLQGAAAYWMMATVGLLLAGVLMIGFMAWVQRQKAAG